MGKMKNAYRIFIRMGWMIRGLSTSRGWKFSSSPPHPDWL
jgi:hypothetical protein